MNRFTPTCALVWREVRGSLRRWRTVGILAVWLACAFLVPYTMWPDRMISPLQFASQSRQMITALCAMVLAGIGLTVPAIAAVSISSERDEELLDQLRLTLITDGGLIRGKAAASLLLGLLLIFSLFPVISVAQFIVGLDGRQIAQLLGYLVVFSLACAMGGVLCSTLFRRALVAITVAYACVSLVLFVPIIVLARTLLIGRGGWGSVMGVPSISPAGVVNEIITFGMTPDEYAMACIVPLCASWAMYAVAVRRVTRLTESIHISDEKLEDDQAVLRARRQRFPFYLIDPLRRKPLIADGRNPMAVREIRWGLFSRGTSVVRVFYGTFILFIFPMLGACMDQDARDCVLLIGLQMVMIVFAAPVLVGSAWTKERELGNIDMLRMTLLRARDLYWGKVTGGFVALVPVLAALLLTTVPAFVWHSRDSFALVCGCVTLLNCALIALALCLHVSIANRRTTTAIAAGAVLCGTVFFGFYLIALILIGPDFLLVSRQSGYSLQLLSPILAYLLSFGDATGYRSGTAYAVRYGHVPWAFSQLVFTFFAGVFVVLSMVRLVRREMRDR